MKEIGLFKIKYLIYMLFLSLCEITYGIAQNAVSILDKTVTIYEKSNGLTAQFVMQVRSDVQQFSESFEGSIDIKGDKFLLKTPDMITWFDGVTQWGYTERNEEVSISTPTKDEIQVTNPIFLLRSYKKEFNVKYRGESTALNGKTTYDIELIPKKKNDIESVELQIEKYSGLLASITVVTKNGMRNAIRVSQTKMDVDQPDSFFIFNDKDYPDVEIIDLR